MEALRNSQMSKALTATRTLILSGAFAPAERLSEPALAERLKISRTPLREALGRLVEEGLLQRVASGGWQVSSYSMQDIVDAIEIRGTLEGLAARLAAERRVDKDSIADCRRNLKRVDIALNDSKKMDFKIYVDGNAAFHQWVANAANSPILAREIDRVCRLPLASPSAFLSEQENVAAFRDSLFGAQAQHYAILDAIEAAEGTRAEHLAREHARLARQNLKLALTSDRAFDVPGLALVEAD